ncbi:MAG: TIGR03364 family FAD-dependent oxidoreductase [Anaerolineae bacterium]
MPSYDLIIIGAGVLGAFHAYFAAQKGARVLLVERNALPNDASTRNFGMVVRTIAPPYGEWSDIVRDSQAIYRELQAQRDLGVRATGSLYVASSETENRVLQEFAQIYGADYRCEYLAAADALYRYHFIRPSYCTGALVFADDLSLDPRVLLARFIPFMTDTLPVEYLPHTNVTSVKAAGDHCAVRTANGKTYIAERVVVCSGAEHRTLFPEVFAQSGLEVCKLQMMRTIPQPIPTLPHCLLSGMSIRRYPGFKACPSYNIMQAEAVDEEITRYDLHLLFKEEMDGSVIIGDSHQYSGFADANLLEERTTPAINDALLRYAQKMVSLPTWTIQSIWNGYYLLHREKAVFTHTIDGRIHIVTGIGGKGMSSSPGFARRSVETLLAEQTVA